MRFCGCQRLVGFLILLWFPIMIQGQSTQVDSFRLKRDIRIMEGILDKLLDQETSNLRMPGAPKGIYIPDYGMVFYMKKTQPYQPKWLATLEENFNQTRTNQTQIQTNKKISPKEKDQFAKLQKEAEALEIKSLEDMKTGITEFLGNYASSSSLIQNKDRIAVLVHLEGWRSLAHQNEFLTAWVDQKHAEAMRQSRGNNVSLKSNIHFDLSADDHSIAKDIDIMTAILDQAMATGSSPRFASTSGIYLKDLGALLFMNLQPAFWFGNSDSSFSIVVHNQGDAVSGYSFNVNTHNSDKKTNTSTQMHELSDELFDLLASYGHTINLKPDEQIIIEVNLGSKFSFFNQGRNELSNIRMQLTKHDLDMYNQGKMTIKELKKKLVVHHM